MNIRSLRTRSLITTVAVVIPLLTIYTIVSHSHVDDQLSERFDRRMRGELDMLEQAVGNSGGDTARLRGIIDAIPVETFPHRRSIAAWADGELVIASEELPFHSMPRVTRGFDIVDAAGSEWRTCSTIVAASPYNGNREFLLMVAEPMPTRTALVRGALLDILVPLLIGVPLVIGGIYMALARSLKPLTDLAHEIGDRSADQLLPIATGRVPSEALPIADSVNHLMARLGESLDSERRFTADAAHELRTPLTALKAHAQVALLTEDDRLRRETLHSIARTVNRTDRMISQLLALARFDPDAGHACSDLVDLGRIAAQTLLDLNDLAEARQHELQLSAESRVLVRGNPDALAVLARNIVENAIQYADDGTPIDIRVFRDRKHGVLEVRDSGPGIPDRDKREVFRRFRRIPGTKAAGTGLGLSIVQRIAELHGGRVSLRDADSGTGVCVAAAIPTCEG